MPKIIDDKFWPPSQAFLPLEDIQQSGDGKVRCTTVAVCDDQGEPKTAFHQGEWAHFFYEFEILDNMGVPSGGVELRDSNGVVVHGKNTFQYGSPVPEQVRKGTRLRFHQKIALELRPGRYSFTVGLGSAEKQAYQSYRDGRIGHNEFASKVQAHGRAVDVGRITVGLGRRGELLHHGVANLPGDCYVRPLTSTPLDILRVAFASLKSEPPDDDMPAVFHITHWKAGSQWIHKILRECVPERIVPPQLHEVQFLNQPLQPGKVYPTLYVTKQQFDSVRLPSNWHRFVIIRDLRDTLVSAYFSIKVSHPVMGTKIALWRSTLQSLSIEDGLIYLMDEWLPPSARIQLSWLESGEPLIRYEDLLEHDLEILEPVLLNECQLPVACEQFRKVVLANRFERLTGGRPRGQEDISAHERKGIASDWRNYFSEQVKQAFKARYGGLLVAMGYEQDLNW